MIDTFPEHKQKFESLSDALGKWDEHTAIGVTQGGSGRRKSRGAKPAAKDADIYKNGRS